MKKILWSIFTIYHLPVKSLIFTILPVNLKAGKSSTLLTTNICNIWNKALQSLKCPSHYLLESRGQFHQRSTSSFYVRRSWKRKKTVFKFKINVVLLTKLDNWSLI